MTAREPELDVDEPSCDEPFGDHDSCGGLSMFNPLLRGSHLCTLHANHAGTHECGDCGAHEAGCDCIDCVTAAGVAQDEAAREFQDECGLPNRRAV